MINISKKVVGAVVVAVLLLGAWVVSTRSAGDSAATTNYGGGLSVTDFSASGATTLTSTVAVGSSGTAFTRINGGLCYIRPYAATITATSTAKVDCQATAAWNASGMSALAGVTAGDAVNVTLATSTAGSTLAGIRIIAASASTTAGYIELTISNLTGTTYTWPTTGTASGTASYIATDI